MTQYKTINRPTWTWFTDPQDQYDPVSNQVYIGVQFHDRPALMTYDCETGQVATVLLGPLPAVLELDDHNQPSVNVLANGHILVRYMRHNTTDGWWYQVSVRPNDSSEFHPPQFVVDFQNTYSHVWEIDGIVYAMSRSAETNRNWKVWQAPIGTGPTLDWTANGGVWTGDGDGVNANGTFGYLVSKQTGDRVDFLVSDDHPVHRGDRVGHFYFDGEYRRTDGTVLTAPFSFDDVTLVFDADQPGTGDRVWVTDVAFDGVNPRALWMRYPNGSGTIHESNHSQWDGTNWVHRVVTEVQGTNWLPPERFYNGEAHFDPSNIDNLIQAVEVNGIYEIQHWGWLGDRYAVGSFTRLSPRNQLRPRLVSLGGKDLLAYWIDPTRYPDFDDYDSNITFNRVS